MNTYGLHSINTHTFNLKWHTNYTYPQQLRNIVVTLFRVHNFSLNILGYIPGVSFVSGCVRMGTGLLMCAVTLKIGDRNATEGAIIGHWYDEALRTGVTQIARGALEAFVPFGRIVNGVFDVVGTICNLTGEAVAASVCTGCMGYENHGPHPDVNYSGILMFLKLA